MLRSREHLWEYITELSRPHLPSSELTETCTVIALLIIWEMFKPSAHGNIHRPLTCVQLCMRCIHVSPDSVGRLFKMSSCLAVSAPALTCGAVVLLRMLFEPCLQELSVRVLIFLKKGWIRKHCLHKNSMMLNADVKKSHYCLDILGMFASVSLGAISCCTGRST